MLILPKFTHRFDIIPIKIQAEFLFFLTNWFWTLSGNAKRPRTGKMILKQRRDLVLWGCYNKNAINWWLKQQKYTFHSSQGWEIQDHVVKEGRRERGRKQALRRRALTPTVLGDPPSQPHQNPVTSQRPHLQMPSLHWGSEFRMNLVSTRTWIQNQQQSGRLAISWFQSLP